MLENDITEWASVVAALGVFTDTVSAPNPKRSSFVPLSDGSGAEAALRSSTGCLFSKYFLLSSRDAFIARLNSASSSSLVRGTLAMRDEYVLP